MPIEVIDPNLRAGWEADTPVEDSLLRRFLTNWTAAIEAHGVPGGSSVLRRDDVAAADLGRPSFGGNVATLLAPLFPADVEEVMAALDDLYAFSAGGKSGAAFLFSPWPTPDLRPHGWTLTGYEPLMLRPVGGEPPPTPPGLTIEEVRDEAGLRDFEVAIVRGFGSDDPEMLRPGAVFGPGVLSDDRVRLWVGREEGQAVSAAAAFVAAGINDVTLVGTLPEARGRGLGAALTMRAALADPSLPSMLLSTDDGLPVYERLGYLSLFRFPVWTRDRPAR
jgi:hypothetical protein